MVNRRASLSLLAYPKLPAIASRKPEQSLLGKEIPPDSACRKALPLALALPLHLCRGPGARAIRAGSIGRDISWKVECVSHPPEGAGCFFPPHPRRNQRLMLPSGAPWLPGLGKAVRKNWGWARRGYPSGGARHLHRGIRPMGMGWEGRIGLRECAQ